MLDTDSVSFALRGQGKVGEQILRHRPSEIHVSSITVAELRLGAERKNSRKLQRLIDSFLDPIAVIPFDENAANRFGAVALALMGQGTPIGQFDTLIAAHALSAKLTLVSNNTKRFSRVPGIKLENWI